MMHLISILCATLSLSQTHNNTLSLSHTHNTLSLTHTHTHQEADLEFFTDEALKEAGIAKAIARAKMLRQIRDHFNLNPKP